jgi:hypothetical protein
VAAVAAGESVDDPHAATRRKLQVVRIRVVTTEVLLDFTLPMGHVARSRALGKA